MTEDGVKSSVVSQSRVGQRKLKLVTARRNLDCQRKTYHIMNKSGQNMILQCTLDIWERLLNCSRGEIHLVLTSNESSPFTDNH